MASVGSLLGKAIEKVQSRYFDRPKETFPSVALQLAIFVLFIIFVYLLLIVNILSDIVPSSPSPTQKPTSRRINKQKSKSLTILEGNEEQRRPPKNHQTIVWVYLRAIYQIVPEEQSSEIAKSSRSVKIGDQDIVTLPSGSYAPVFQSGIEQFPYFSSKDPWFTLQECQCGFTSTDRSTIIRHVIKCDSERRKQIPGASEHPLATIAKWLSYHN